MNLRIFYSLLFVIITSVILCVSLWEIVFEEIILGYFFDEAESYEDPLEKLEYVVTTLAFTVVSLIFPTVIGHRLIRKNQLITTELLIINSELESRVQQRTLDLEESKRHEQLANASKTMFLSNMSHEIRTPLTAIIGFSETLLESDQTETNRLKNINIIIRSGKHLLNLVNEVLDLSKIEANKLEIENVPVFLHDLLFDLNSLVELQAKEKALVFNIKYEFPLPEYISTDPLRLKQILINLCNNALKFTDKGSVTVLVGCYFDKELLSFSVIDTGIGIKEESFEKLFTSFSQAESSMARKFGGTGLGLSLSKLLAEKLGGGITVESQYGVGSRFTATVKTGDLDLVKQVTSFDIAPIVSYNNSDECMRTGVGAILLVEDNPENQQLVSFYLKTFGAEVEIASNGVEDLEFS